MGRARRAALRACLPACHCRVRQGVSGWVGGLQEGDVTERAGGITNGWRASRCVRLLPADPRPAPVLSPAAPGGGWVSRQMARPRGGAGWPLRAGPLWLLFHVEQRPLGGVGSAASAARRQHLGRGVVCAGASEAGAQAGSRYVPRGTSGGPPAPRAAQPPLKWRRGAVVRP
jgi:hypothetical protein